MLSRLFNRSYLLSSPKYHWKLCVSIFSISIILHLLNYEKNIQNFQNNKPRKLAPIGSIPFAETDEQASPTRDTAISTRDVALSTREPFNSFERKNEFVTGRDWPQRVGD